MKLCKNCKHAILPHPLSGLSGQSVANPMCGHPLAKRNVVYGNCETSCIEARGDGCMGATDKSICWPAAKLFEQAPPPPPMPEMKPYAVPPVRERRGFFKRIFG